METRRIPLFPLDVVLFPATPLPLHIFEPRYKEMIRRCLEEKSEFGIVLAQPENIAAFGCTTEIIRVLETFEDGSMDILAFGHAAFRILEVFEGKPYLEAAVEIYPEVASPDWTMLDASLAELYRECYRLVFARPAETIESSTLGPLSYRIASELPIPLPQKQEILELRDETKRQRRLIALLTTLLPQLHHLERVRLGSGGNGHPLG